MRRCAGAATGTRQMSAGSLSSAAPRITYPRRLQGRPERDPVAVAYQVRCGPETSDFALDLPAAAGCGEGAVRHSQVVPRGKGSRCTPLAPH